MQIKVKVRRVKVKERAIIFGTGRSATLIFYKYREKYEFVAFSDNNCNKWNTKFLGLQVIEPIQISEYNVESVLVASIYYPEICRQLEDMRVSNISYKGNASGLLIPYNGSKQINSKIQKLSKILYVQNAPCIRTYKIASIMRDQGIQVDLAYLTVHPQLAFGSLPLPWKNIYSIENISEFMQFINDSDYDIIHHSNEPDALSALLLHSNKKIVHDTHDLMSYRGDITLAETVNEYVSNKFSNGCIYVTEEQKKIAEERFGIQYKKTFILENLMYGNFHVKNAKEKLSSKDGELHCVYEGGIHCNKNGYRFFDNIFLRLAERKIHVHFYTQSTDYNHYYKMTDKSPYIHYEGNRTIEDLVEEMTQYDVGLCIFNIRGKIKKHLKSSSPNKLFDYLAAGIPVAVSNQIPIFADFVEKYKVGQPLDWEACDAKEKIEEIARIKVETDFLNKNELLMDNKALALLNFYIEVKNS